MQTCGFVFMNHVRQQAMGNICIALLNGSKVYMNAQSLAYNWFLDKGCFVESMQTLLAEKSTEKVKLEPISDEERGRNSSAVIGCWGREVQQAKMRSLVDTVLGIKE